MYFSLLPDISYDQKPVSYPFSESDFIITKNFFKRFQIDPNLFAYSTFYNKALTYFKLKDVKKACIDLKKSIKLGKEVFKGEYLKICP